MNGLITSFLFINFLISKILHLSKLLRPLKPLEYFISVFNMFFLVFDSGIEYVAEGVLTHVVHR